MAGWRSWTVLGIVVLAFGAAAARGSAPRSSEAAAFLGTWAFTMTEPSEFRGTQQTVRIWDQNGVLAASFQIERFPKTDATGISQDGDMLVLTIGHDARPQILENGAPIWAVISLTLDGETMRMAQMLERSQTIKRGTGKKVAN